MARRDGKRKIVVEGREYSWLRGRSNAKIVGEDFSLVRPLEAVGDVSDSEDLGHVVVVTPAHIRAAILADDPAQTLSLRQKAG